MIWRLSLVDDSVVLIAEIQRVEKATVRVLTDGLVARVIQILLREIRIHTDLILGVQVLKQEGHGEDRAGSATALIPDADPKLLNLRPQVSIGLVCQLDNNVGDGDVKWLGYDACRPIANPPDNLRRDLDLALLGLNALNRFLGESENERA